MKKSLAIAYKMKKMAFGGKVGGGMDDELDKLGKLHETIREEDLPKDPPERDMTGDDDDELTSTTDPVMGPGAFAEGGIVDRIMQKRAIGSETVVGTDPRDNEGPEPATQVYSEGGRVANDTAKHDEIDQYDDLVLRDDLAFSETGANSGDELSSDGEDERRKDIVSRVMRSRRLKDKMPSPA